MLAASSINRLRKWHGAWAACCLLAFTLPAAARASEYAEKGVVDLGGSGTVSVTTLGNATQTIVNLRPGVGLFVLKGLRLGLDGIFQLTNSGAQTDTAVGGGMSIAKYFLIGDRTFPYIGLAAAAESVPVLGVVPIFGAFGGASFQIGTGGLISVGPYVQLIPVNGQWQLRLSVSIGTAVYF